MRVCRSPFRTRAANCDGGYRYGSDDCSPGWPNFNFAGYLCSVEPAAAVGSQIELSVDAACEDKIVMLNPGLYVPGLTDVEGGFQTVRPSVIVLQQPPSNCDLQEFIQVDGQTFQHEPRLKLLDVTTPAEVCVAVPKTPMNVEACEVQAGRVCDLARGTDSALILNSSTLQLISEHANRHVFTVSGLSTSLSPCGTLARWKLLDCSTESCAASSLQANDLSLLRTALSTQVGGLRDVYVNCASVSAGSVVEAALQILSNSFSSSKAPSVYSFNAVIAACGRGFKWQQSLALLLQMETFQTQPDVVSYNAGISACEKGGEWQMALYLLSQMPAAGIVPDPISFNAGISACEKGGEWQMALYLLSQMPEAGVVPDQISFNAGVSACEKGGEWQMALQLLSQMPAATVVPDRISFNAGISACGNGGEWQMALYLLSQMPAAGVVPGQISFNAGISACEKGAEWQMALYLLSQMPAAGVVPNRISFNAGISACGNGGEWQMALYLLSQMPAAGVVPGQISFNAGISACGNGGEWQMALYLLSQMPAAGVVPDQISFNASISACEKGGEWQMALYLLSQMPEAGVVPDQISFHAGISACEKGGEWQMALQLLSQMPAASVVPDQLSFNAGICACKKGGEWQMALHLLSHMPAAGVEPSEISFSACIKSCGTARIWELALYLFASIRENQLQPGVASYGQAIDAVLPEVVSFDLFDQAMKDRTWPDMLRRGGAWLDLHDHSCGSAMLAVSWWLAKVVGSDTFQHVHIHEGNVYDFTEWVSSHPGGSTAITKWSSSGYTLQYPGNHPLERFETQVNNNVLQYIGKTDSEVRYLDLPTSLKTDSLALALANSTSNSQTLSLACPSPGEVANDPQLGNNMPFYYRFIDFSDLRNDLDFDHPSEHKHSGRPRLPRISAWMNQVARAPDQLRQRMAWALSQILVVGLGGFTYSEQHEIWAAWHRHGSSVRVLLP
eukprot:s4135_g1.t1